MCIRMTFTVLGLIATIPVSAQQQQPDFERIAREAEFLGNAEIRRENNTSFLQYDEETQSWNYTISRKDGSTRSDSVKATELRRGERLDAWEDTDLATLSERPIEDIEAEGEAAKQQLESEQSVYGDAHRLSRSGNRQSTDELLTEDGMWGQTDAMRSTMATVHAEFGGCEVIRENRRTTYTAGVTHEIKTCERYTALTTCSRTREVDTVEQTIEPFTYGASGLTSPQTYHVNLLEHLPSGFDLADAVSELSWDGTVQSVDIDPPWVGNGWQMTLTVVLDPEQFSCEAGCTVNDPECACQLSGTPQSYNAEVGVTILGLRSMMVSEPEGCLEASDGFCSATWQCTDNAPRTINGVVIGAHNAGGLPPLYPHGNHNTPPDSQDPFCWAATATYECPYNIGSAGCWDTPSGLTICHENLPGEVMEPVGGAEINTCPGLIWPGCFEVARDCAGNATGHNGHCYVESVTYACPTTWASENIQTRERFECGNESSLRCLGDDCLPYTSQFRNPPSAGQVESRAKLKALQHLFTDYTYQDDTFTSVWTMAGVPIQCRKSLGGSLDNCNITDDSTTQSYQLLTDLVARVDAGLTTLILADADPSEPETGSAAAMANPSGHRWDVVGQRNLVNTKENVLGDATSADSLVSTAYSRVHSAWGVSAADYLYGSGAHGGLDLSRSSLYRAKNAYDISVRETVPEDWMGTEDEYVLSLNKGLGACLHIGGVCKRNVDQPLNGCAEYMDTFCCYDSHIARIFHEYEPQIAGLAAGGDFGTPEAPQCPGFISLPDGQGFDTLPLNEIVGWEAKAGLAPTTEDVDTRYDQDRLTGQGSHLGPSGRRTRDERTERRLDRIAIDQMRSTVGQEIQSQVDSPVDEPEGPGDIQLRARVMTAKPGDRVRISVMRTGGAGAASVRVTVNPWTGQAAGWPAVDEVVEWGSGEVGAKHVIVPLPGVGPGVAPFTAETSVQLSEASGAALTAAGASGRITVVHR